MRSFRAKHNLIAVSANLREPAINTLVALDTSMMVDMSDMMNLEPRRENNVGELTGLEEADFIYDLGALSSLGLNFSKAAPQHFAFILAYALGACTSAPAGDGYLHTITPLDGDLDAYRSNPSFTAAMRYGQTIAERVFASMFVDSFTASFAKDAWCKIAAQCKGTGYNTNAMVEEEVEAAGNATSLTLDANPVAGATAAARLDNVHRIRVELTEGVWTEVEYTAVSGASPAVITITDPEGTSDPVAYKILYNTSLSTFPARVEETPLRVSQMCMMIGGTWNGSAWVGGREVNAELNSVEWTLNNALEITFGPCAGGAYANRCFRPARTQTLSLNREFRDFILQNYMTTNETFGVRILAQGALYDDTNYYTVELIFPRVGVLKSPISVDGQKNAEAGDLTVMWDATYGSVIARVKNMVATYAAEAQT